MGEAAWSTMAPGFTERTFSSTRSTFSGSAVCTLFTMMTSAMRTLVSPG